MFLDSHVEVLNGWLLYLLEEIQKDRFVCRTISSFDDFSQRKIEKQLFVRSLMF